MKTVSGKQFAKLLEKNGWELLRIQVIIFTGKAETKREFPFRFIKIKI